MFIIIVIINNNTYNINFIYLCSKTQKLQFLVRFKNALRQQ